MTVIHMPAVPRREGKSFFQRLASGISRAAVSVGLGPIKTKHDTRAKVSPTLGKKGTPHRRIIKYDREGPFYRQTGITWRAGECHPILQGYFVHKLLHATKGWRVFTGGARLSMPQAGQSRPARLAFYGSHYGVPR